MLTNVFSAADINTIAQLKGIKKSAPSPFAQGYHIINQTGAIVRLVDDMGQEIAHVPPYTIATGTIMQASRTLYFQVLAADPVLNSNDYPLSSWSLEYEVFTDPLPITYVPLGTSNSGTNVLGTVQVAGNVTITGTPLVQISGSPTVLIGNSPSVTILGTTNVAIVSGSVTITSGSVTITSGTVTNKPLAASAGAVSGSVFRLGNSVGFVVAIANQAVSTRILRLVLSFSAFTATATANTRYLFFWHIKITGHTSLVTLNVAQGIAQFYSDAAGNGTVNLSPFTVECDLDMTTLADTAVDVQFQGSSTPSTALAQLGAAITMFFT